MELRELKSFSTAAKLRSISLAAERLGVGQPTVTTHIKKLEEELGVVLFDRVRRPIRLTASGAALAELAEPLLDGIAGLAARTSTAEELVPVRVAATYDIIPHTLLLVVKNFMSAYGHAHIRIRSGGRGGVLDMVKESEVDIGIMPGPEKGSNFEFEGLFPYERVLIVPKGHSLLHSTLWSMEQIAPWPLIMMQRGTYTRGIVEEEFRRNGLSYEIVIELDSMDMIKRYVALGLGVSIGPRLAIEPEDLHELGIVSLTTLLPVEQAGILTLRGRTLSEPARNFVSVLRETLSHSPVQAA